MAYKAIQSVDELASQLQAYNYTPMSDADMRASAEAFYAPSRDQALLNALQAYQTGDLNYQQQLNSLGTAYDRQIESQRQATAQSLSAADRQAMIRGMQRSSYNNATMSNIRLKGDEAIGKIQQDRTNAEQNIMGQRGLLAQQYQQNVANAYSSFEQNVLNRLMQLQDQNYERQQASMANMNNMLTQLYNLSFQEKQYNDQRADLEEQKKKSGGYSYTPPKDTTGDDKNTTGLSWADFMKNMGSLFPTEENSELKKLVVKHGSTGVDALVRLRD